MTKWFKSLCPGCYPNGLTASSSALASALRGSSKVSPGAISRKHKVQAVQVTLQNHMFGNLKSYHLDWFQLPEGGTNFQAPNPTTSEGKKWPPWCLWISNLWVPVSKTWTTPIYCWACSIVNLYEFVHELPLMILGMHIQVPILWKLCLGLSPRYQCMKEMFDDPDDLSGVFQQFTSHKNAIPSSYPPVIKHAAWSKVTPWSCWWYPHIIPRFDHHETNMLVVNWYLIFSQYIYIYVSIYIYIPNNTNILWESGSQSHPK